jgi:hypothetical protein
LIRLSKSNRYSKLFESAIHTIKEFPSQEQIDSYRQKIFTINWKNLHFLKKLFWTHFSSKYLPFGSKLYIHKTTITCTTFITIFGWKSLHFLFRKSINDFFSHVCILEKSWCSWDFKEHFFNDQRTSILYTTRKCSWIIQEHSLETKEFLCFYWSLWVLKNEKFQKSNSAGKVFPLEPHFEATRKFSGPKKIPRAYFDLLHLCAKFYPKRLTLSASNPQAKNLPKGIIWTWLL